MKIVKVAIGCVFFSILASMIQRTQTKFRDEDINWTSISNSAVWVIHLCGNIKEITDNAPKMYAFIKTLATDVKSVAATVNPAYAAAVVYFTGVLSVSCYYRVEAQQQLQKAQFKKDDLKVIIDTEIIPILTSLEEGNMENFCRAKHTFGTIFGNALTSLQAVRKDIERLTLDSISAAERNKFLQIVCATGGVASIAAMPTAPVAGLIGLLSSVACFSIGRSNRMTHKETMTLLKVTRLQALEVEKVFRRARTDAEIMCADHLSFSEKQLNSLVEIYESIEVMKDQIQGRQVREE